MRLLPRSLFAAVLVAGAALFGAGVHGIAGIDTELQLAAQRTHDEPAQAGYDGWNCPDEPRV